MTARAITGAGIVSSLGVGRGAVWEALGKGVTTSTRPRSPVTVFDAQAYRDAAEHLVEVPDFDAARYLGDKGLRSLDRQTKLLVVAARLCLEDAGLKRDGAFVALRPERVGLCASNAYGSLEAVTELDRVAVLEDPRYINPAKFPNTVANSASGYVSIWEDLRALNVAVSDGNCGALDAVTCADVYLETGRADAIVIGGVEALSEALFLAFRRLGVLARRTILGEGAALFALETLAGAEARGARIDALVLGTGTSYKAPPHAASLLYASSEAMERAIVNALAESKVDAKEVDLVVSGVGEAGAFADAELLGVTRALGESTPVAAPKTHFGETLGAGGAMGMVAALAWMGGVPVTALARGALPATGRVRTTVVTSLGFYGNATAVVLRHA